MTAPYPEAPGDTWRYPITRRQREALVWIARGYTAAQAAARMGCAVNTVNPLLNKAYRKLGARSAPHAVALAMARGLLAPSDIGVAALSAPVSASQPPRAPGPHPTPTSPSEPRP